VALVLGCWAARPGKPGKPPFLFLPFLFSVFISSFEFGIQIDFCFILQVLNYLNVNIT
jgi:hypothetical protein